MAAKKVRLLQKILRVLKRGLAGVIEPRDRQIAQRYEEILTQRVVRHGGEPASGTNGRH
jgi:hypothetical protein